MEIIDGGSHMSQKIRALNAATTPTKIDTPYGERILELVGRTVEPRTISHSFAEVVLPPGKASRRHLHPEAEETYYILKGTAYVELGAEAGHLSVGDAVVIPADTAHKIYNHGQEDLLFLVACAPAWEPGNTVWLEPIAEQD
jgi:mannose-6-phosphate isomerase-like protein (cupin superfamily)